MGFDVDSIPNLEGKTVLITGANSGLGLESAKELAKRGARVLVGARARDKAEAAIAEIRAAGARGELEPLVFDLADLGSVRAAAQEVRAHQGRLDVLMNNAGVMALPYGHTKDGFELQFGTNHLGHFALTGLLFDLLKATPGARVVNVSSSAHALGKMRFDDLRWERKYARWNAYGMSKLANLLFTYELARRAKLAGLALISVATHPGYAATNLQYRGETLQTNILKVMNALFAQPVRVGALPQIYAAVAPDVQSGDYFGPGRVWETRGSPKKVRSNARSHDPEDQRRLWELSEQLTGVQFGLPSDPAQRFDASSPASA